MTKETALRAANLLHEIEDLRKYSKLLTNPDKGRVAHFEFVQHYGSCADYERVVIEHKHTKRMVLELEKIIVEMEDELSNLKD